MIDIVSQISVEGIMKWVFVLMFVMYAGFGAVVVMQVRVMSETFESGVNGIMKTLAVLHLAAAILLAAVSVVIL